MKGRVKVVLITVLFIVATQVVIVQAMGINIIDLVTKKTDSLAVSSTTGTSDSLEQAKQEALSSTSAYIDSYIGEIQSTLGDYVDEEEAMAKQQMYLKVQEVLDSLESQKGQAISEGKVKIKIKVDEELNKKLSELESEISIKIKEKFK
ncbi:MAG: hypothetical protein GX660_27105 [Clostridiaceae bacterium]|nr:hypothetical protein [Clostridiaceae bacterium]